MLEVSIGKSFDIDLFINYGVLEYIAGLDESKEWEIRGLAGHKPKAAKRSLEQRKQKVQELIQKQSFKEELNKFIKEALNLFNAFINNNGIISKYISNRNFYFVMGSPKTGGTYIYKEVSRAVGWPWKNLLRSMTHDSMPNGYFIRGEKNEIGGMGWREPMKYFNLLFQISQFLVYMDK
ncbi:hypothetical protein JCM16358_19380 [Halanaerocella petrolearia]